MSTYKPINQVIQEVQHWLRLSVFKHGPLKESLLYVLHNKGNDSNYVGLPSSPTDLYNELSTTHNATINKLVNKKILKADQLELLLPTDGSNKTFSDKFDITLTVLLIRSCTTLRPPKCGWNATLTQTDTSPAANVLRARDWRNFLNHTNAEDVNQALFNQKWNEGVQIVQQIGYTPPDLNNLRTISLDPKNEFVLQSLHSLINNIVATQQKNQNDIVAIKQQVTAQADTNKLLQTEVNQIETNVDSLNKHLDSQADLAKMNQKVTKKSVDELNQRVDEQTELMVADNEVMNHQLQQQTNRIENVAQQLDQLTELVVADNEVIQQNIDGLNQSIDTKANKEEIEETRQFLGNQINQKVEKVQQSMDDRTDLMSDQIQTITRKIEILNELKDKESKINNSGFSDFSQNCCKDVLNHVAENIGENWYQLLTLLTKSQGESQINQQDSNGKSPFDQVMDFFKKLAFQIRWNDLKKTLQALELNGMVNYIEQNTLITQGLQLASNKLRQRYLNDLINWFLDQPLSTTNVGNNSLSREEAYIDLAVISSATVDQEWSNSDRVTLMKQKYMEFKSIEMRDTLTETDQLVIVRGVAGVGKSTYIQMLTLKWAKDEILNDQKNNIDFLFTFTCRGINTLPHHFASFEELLKTTYPDIFEYVAISDLQMVADRVLIVVDGLDELSGMYQEDPTANLSNNAETVMSLIDTKHGVLKGHKTIACGRPNACETVKKRFAGTQQLKMVEVCGFRKAMIERYVNIFFKNDSVKCKKVLEVINKSINLQMMASIPIFLWVICSIYADDSNIEIHSVTELYIYGLLVFLKNHLQGCMNIKNKSLQDLADSPTIGEIVFFLAKLSTKTYMQHKVIFTQDDLGSIHCPIHMEQTGFITKLSTGNLYRECYQFKHLAFQEFLCALYLCLTNGNTVLIQKRELSSCKQSIIGIHYLAKDGRNLIFTELYTNLEAIHKSHTTFKDTLKAPLVRLSYKNFLKETLKWNNKLSKFIKGDKLYIDYRSSDFLESFRESGCILSRKQLERYPNVTNAEIEFSSLLHMETVLELINLLKVPKIDYFFYKKYSFQTDDMFSRNFYQFADLVVKKTSKTELIIYFSHITGDESLKLIWNKGDFELPFGGVSSLPDRFLDYFKLFSFIDTSWHMDLHEDQKTCVINLAKYVLKNKDLDKSIFFRYDGLNFTEGKIIALLKINLPETWKQCIINDKDMNQFGV